MSRVEAHLREESIFNQIKLIIFDWSGTLSIDMLVCCEANRRTIPSLRNASYEDWQRINQPCFTLWEFLNKVGWQETLEEFRKANKANYDQVIAEGIFVPKLREEAEEVLKKLTALKMPVIVVSNHPQQNIETEAEGYGIAHFFDQLIGGVPNQKDEILKEVCEALDCSPSEAVYICDSKGDIESSKKAGILSIAVEGGWTPADILAQENPDFQISDLTGLLSL